MPYGFFTAASAAFAVITKNFGGGDTTYNIDGTMGSFAASCNATLTDVEAPAGAGIFGTMVCNTNTGDLVTEAGISINIVANASSLLVNCLVAQAQAYQGDNYCNGDNSIDMRIVWGVLGGLLGLVALGSCCKALSKKTEAAKATDAHRATPATALLSERPGGSDGVDMTSITVTPGN